MHIAQPRITGRCGITELRKKCKQISQGLKPQDTNNVRIFLDLSCFTAKHRRFTATMSETSWPFLMHLLTFSTWFEPVLNGATAAAFIVNIVLDGGGQKFFFTSSLQRSIRPGPQLTKICFTSIVAQTGEEVQYLSRNDIFQQDFWP